MTSPECVVVPAHAATRAENGQVGAIEQAQVLVSSDVQRPLSVSGGAGPVRALARTINDLAAMMAMQFEHAGVAALWPLVEAALLAPDAPLATPCGPYSPPPIA